MKKMKNKLALFALIAGVACVPMTTMTSDPKSTESDFLKIKQRMHRYRGPGVWHTGLEALMMSLTPQERGQARHELKRLENLIQSGRAAMDAIKGALDLEALKDALAAAKKVK